MNNLHVLWTSADKEVALNMIFMYVLNAKKNRWWDDINLIVWGPSARLVAEDSQIAGEVIELLHAGIQIEACKACSDIYGVSDRLSSLGIHVKYMGVSLTGYMKSNEKTLTF